MESDEYPDVNEELEISSQLPEPLNLTTINNDCKEHIFAYLDWKDLISIADTSKQLTTAARDVFGRKYRNARINFGDFKKSAFGTCLDADILILRRVLSLKLLRNFGHLIAKLHVNFWTFHLSETGADCKYEYKLIIFLLQYLCEYGSKSFIRLSLYGTYCSILKHIKKPFTSVKVLRIEKCLLESLFPINTLFPNLQTLKLGMNDYWPLSSIQCHFPTVKHLSFNDNNNFRKVQFERDDIEQLLKLNPQLEKLELILYKLGGYGGLRKCDRSLLQCFPKYFPYLKRLKLKNLQSWSSRFPEPICFDHIEHLSLEKSPVKISVTKLKYLEVDNYKSFSEISKTNEHLTTLKIFECLDNMAVFLEDRYVLMNIKELCIDNFKYEDIPSECILRFLKENRSLNKISIIYRFRESFNDFLNALIFYNTKLKIRNKALEFMIERNSDRASKKYVLRHLTRFRYGCRNVEKMMELTTYEESKMTNAHVTIEDINAVLEMRRIWGVGLVQKKQEEMK